MVCDVYVGFFRFDLHDVSELCLACQHIISCHFAILPFGNGNSAIFFSAVEVASFRLDGYGFDRCFGVDGSGSSNDWMGIECLDALFFILENASLERGTSVSSILIGINASLPRIPRYM